MSLELHDCGNLKLQEEVHSALKVEALVDGVDLMTVIRRVLLVHTQRASPISTLAQKIHHRKGLGEISGAQD